jgi:hypothetical protein
MIEKDIFQRIKDGEWDLAPRPRLTKENKDNGYRTLIDEWYKTNSKIMVDFQNAVMEHIGLTGYHREDKLFCLAWEHGHSEGLHNVVHWAEELAQII